MLSIMGVSLMLEQGTRRLALTWVQLSVGSFRNRLGWSRCCFSGGWRCVCIWFFYYKNFK